MTCGWDREGRSDRRIPTRCQRWWPGSLRGRAEEEYVSRKHGRAKDEGIPLMATKTKATEPASKKSKDNP